MPESPLFHPSQKLVRCEAVNRYRETSVRFVELDAFRLWEYLMTHKHGLRIGAPRLCLWIDGREYEDNSNVFDRAGEAEPVDRVVVDLFDREYRFSQSIVRYARHAEAGRLVDILRSHIPPGQYAEEDCRIETVPGRAVQQWHPSAGRNILLGLEG